MKREARGSIRTRVRFVGAGVGIGIVLRILLGFLGVEPGLSQFFLTPGWVILEGVRSLFFTLVSSNVLSYPIFFGLVFLVLGSVYERKRSLRSTVLAFIVIWAGLFLLQALFILLAFLNFHPVFL